jgi:hypothetical protein
MAGRAGKRRRVLRGGSFNNNEDNARAASRNNNDPDNEWNNNGFRCGCGAAFHISPCSTVSERNALLPRPEMRCVHGHGAEAEL